MIEEMKKFFNNISGKDFIEKWNEIEVKDEKGLELGYYCDFLQERIHLKSKPDIRTNNIKITNRAPFYTELCYL